MTSNKTQSHLTWTTKPGSNRADSDRGGYWITWANAGWCVWHNALVIVDGHTRSIGAGTKQQCLDACERHFSSNNNVSSPQQELI